MVNVVENCACVDQANVVPVDEERPPKDLLIAKGRISSLGPVERFKIACISYRR